MEDCSRYMAARKLYTVAFKLAANSLFNVPGFQEVVPFVEFADRPGRPTTGRSANSITRTTSCNVRRSTSSRTEGFFMQWNGTTQRLLNTWIL